MARIVIKVGSHVLSENESLSLNRIENLCELITTLMLHHEVILVSSGAVAAGYSKLKIDKSLLANRQAIAAVGQPFLVSEYQKFFDKDSILVAQVLVNGHDFDSRKRTEHAKSAIKALLKNRVLPIINENDTTTVGELVFGDNDQLSAHVAHFFDADILVILSDIDGYYDSDPRVFNDAKIIKKVTSIKEEELDVAHTPNDTFATGGIVTKLKAADFLLKHNKKMFLASGFDLSDIKSFLLHNKHTGGTIFERGE
jgi:glutamate 5-kinase